MAAARLAGHRRPCETRELKAAERGPLGRLRRRRRRWRRRRRRRWRWRARRWCLAGRRRSSLRGAFVRCCFHCLVVVVIVSLDYADSVGVRHAELANDSKVVLGARIVHVPVEHHAEPGLGHLVGSSGARLPVRPVRPVHERAVVPLPLLVGGVELAAEPDGVSRPTFGQLVRFLCGVQHLQQFVQFRWALRHRQPPVAPARALGLDRGIETDEGVLWFLPRRKGDVVHGWLSLARALLARPRAAARPVPKAVLGDGAVPRRVAAKSPGAIVLEGMQEHRGAAWLFVAEGLGGFSCKELALADAAAAQRADLEVPVGEPAGLLLVLVRLAWPRPRTTSRALI
mmetsp:Transcript_111302/g.278680  ORF Transcript_111302/g.278680 Transcript_111302/m.278680 type:complete len:342 (+) Transcript_111302:960-1985(+)